MRLSTRSALLLIVPAAAALWVVLVAVPGPASSPKGASLRASSPIEPLRLRWCADTVQAYEFCADTTARVSAPKQPLRRTRHRYQGILHFRVFEVSHEVLVGFQMESMRILIENDAGRKEVGPFDSRPFWVRFARTGELLDVTFHEDSTLGTRETLEEAVRTFQCVVPTEVEMRWQTQESHSTGKYLAQYELADDSQIRKQKLRYEESGTTIELSRGVFELSDSSWLARAEVNDRILTETQGGVRLRGSTKASLALLPARQTRLPAALAQTPREARRTIEHHRQAPEPESEPSQVRFTQEDVERTIGALQATDGAGARSLRTLARQLASDPQHIGTLVAQLRRKRVTDGSAAAMIKALGLAGTEQAQEALSGILRGSEWDHADRRSAAITFAFVDVPTELAMSNLWAAADARGDDNQVDLSNTALLALGTTTGALNQHGSSAAEQNRSRLVSHLRKTGDPRVREVILKALGNTRDEAVADEIAYYLEDRDPGTRTASAYALRTMKDAATADRLARRLESESDIGVRQAVSSSLERLPLTTPLVLNLARARLEREPDESTRYALVKLLARHLPKVPGCRETFERLLDTETSSRIRKQIGAALLKLRRSQ